MSDKYKTVITLSLVLLPRIFLNYYYSCTVLPALSAPHQTHACSNSDTQTVKLMTFTLSPTSVHTSGTTSPKTSGTLLLSLPSKINSRHFSSLDTSTDPPLTVCMARARVCVCVRVCVLALWRVCVRVCVCVHSRLCSHNVV